MSVYRVKNWSEFQHYKDRNPTWIKLHKKLLDDAKFQCLPVASRALAPMLWLLASESKDGILDCDLEELAFRLRTTQKTILDGLTPLINKGFLILASNALADRKRVDSPETETEAETETETDISFSDRVESAIDAAEAKVTAKQQRELQQQLFRRWYSAYPKKVAVGAAEKAWYKLDITEEQLDPMLKTLAIQTRLWKAKDPELAYVPHPATYLNARKWEDELPSTAVESAKPQVPRFTGADDDIRAKERLWKQHKHLSKAAIDDMWQQQRDRYRREATGDVVAVGDLLRFPEVGK